MGTQYAETVRLGCTALAIVSRNSTSSDKGIGESSRCNRGLHTFRVLDFTVAVFIKDIRRTVLLCQLQLLPRPNRASALAIKSLQRMVFDTNLPV